MTTSSTSYEPGTIVKVRIRFTAGDTIKRRPAVILTDANYHDSRADAIVAAISCQVDDMYYGDYLLTGWMAAGLPRPSKAKCVLSTIDRSTIEGTYGNLADADFQQVKENLRSVLGLNTKTE